MSLEFTGPGSKPGPSLKGDMFLDKYTRKLYIFNGTQWEEIALTESNYELMKEAR